MCHFVLQPQPQNLVVFHSHCLLKMWYTSLPFSIPAGTVSYRPALGKTSIAVHQWTAKQFWVDRHTFTQQDNIYCLENVQINILNVYLLLKLHYDVCYTYESCLYILQACLVESCPWLI
jgi:hypothetical protein